jgi:hypothetical protein
MSTSIGVSAPSISTVADDVSRVLCREDRPAARVWHGIVAGKAAALGDSASIAALELLKPQFSPTRNAPRCGAQKVSAVSCAQAGSADFAAVFRGPHGILPRS